MPRYYPGPGRPAANSWLLPPWVFWLAVLLAIALVPALREPTLAAGSAILLLALICWPLTLLLGFVLVVFLVARLLSSTPKPRPPAAQAAESFAYLNPLEILVGLVAAAGALLYYGWHELSRWVRRQRQRQRKPTTRRAPRVRR